MARSLMSAFLWLAAYGLLSALAFPIVPDGQSVLSSGLGRKDTKVLILGGGVAGIIAARTLHEQGIDDFIILEARNELGGRLMSRSFGVEGNQWMVEVGANWVQGTQTEDGPANPIWELAKKHNVSLHSSQRVAATYDDSGPFDFQDVFEQSIDNFHKLTRTQGRACQSVSST